MQYKIKVSDDARCDIDKIYDYLENYKSARNNTISKIYEDILDLSFMPRKHKTLYKKNDKNTEYRRIVSKKHIIIYKIEKNKIIVLRVFSPKQNYLNPENFILREKSLVYTIK